VSLGQHVKSHCKCWVYAGEKTQKGYYNYKGSRKEQPAPELEGYLAESRRIAGFIPDGKVNK
jgi:hypothetical protein